MASSPPLPLEAIGGRLGKGMSGLPAGRRVGYPLRSCFKRVLANRATNLMYRVPAIEFVFGGCDRSWAGSAWQRGRCGQDLVETSSLAASSHPFARTDTLLMVLWFIKAQFKTLRARPEIPAGTQQDGWGLPPHLQVSARGRKTPRNPARRQRLGVETALGVAPGRRKEGECPRRRGRTPFGCQMARRVRWPAWLAVVLRSTRASPGRHDSLHPTRPSPQALAPEYPPPRGLNPR
jgi:hypothetical protein